MAAIPLGASLLQGDLLDGVVESALRSVAAQLKAEFRRELGLALRVAQPEAALGLGFERTEAPLVAVPGLNTPVTEHAEGKTGEPTEPKMADRCGLHAMPQRMASFGDATKPAENAQARPVLTEEDQAEIIRMRAEEIAREEAAKKAMRRHRSHSVMFDQPILGQASRCKVVLYHLITSLKFDLCMGVIILLNAISIGLETSTSRRGDHVPFFLHALEYMFLGLYCAELGIRVYVGGREAFQSHWVKFDAVVVIAGCLNLLLTLTSLGGVENLNMIKLIRLFRLAKTVRVLVHFRTLWMLVQGLIYSVMPMFWTAILMLVVIYVFAVIAMETIPLSNADGDATYSIAAHRFDTLGGSMLTLMQFMTFDSVAPVYTPLIFAKPWLFIYFLVFLLLGPIALMNIVTAIMVESALRTANEDQVAKRAWDDMRRKNMMPKLRNLFMTLDTTGDGEVDLEEILNAPSDIKEAMQHIVGLNQLEEVFHLLDYDGSGTVDINEFVEGILRSQGEKPSELFVIMKQGKAILHRLGHLRPSRRSSIEIGCHGDTSP